MSKKTLLGGLSTVLGDRPETAKRGRPVTQTKKVTKSSQEGTKENEVRATFIVNEELLEKLKAVAYWDRVLIKTVVNTALEEAIAKYEKKSGAVNPIPKK
jgi:tyrosyl-tRNA synthetase